MKACPFCGGRPDATAYIGDRSERRSATYFVKCSNCGVKTSEFTSKDEAMKKWDMRSGLADAGPLAGWVDLHSGIILYTLSEDQKPKIHGFNLKNPGDTREHYRLCNWVSTKTFFRSPT